MGRHIPCKYIHKSPPVSQKNRYLYLDQTHPGFLVLDAAGIIRFPLPVTGIYDVTNVTVYLMDIPHLDCIEKVNNRKVKVRLGHRGGEQVPGGSADFHTDSAAFIEIEFKDHVAGSNSSPFTDADRPAQKSFQVFNDPFPGQAKTYELTSQKVIEMRGTLEFGPQQTTTQRYLVVTPTSTESVTITILAEDSTGPDRPEINCHVNIIGRGSGVACILDPASCPAIAPTNGSGHTSYGKGDSFTYSGDGPPYWIAPFIVPKVVFEVGDPEPNAKIIIDDA